MRFLFSFGKIIDRLCIVAGAFLGSQIPQFMQQYTQRLAGHVAELHHLLEQLRKTASNSQKSLDQYVQKFVSSPDADFASQGAFMQGILQRWDELNQALVQLSQSPAWTRPFVFFKELQPDIAQSTFATFQPGINLNLEGLCYAGIGILIGWAFFQLISKCFSAFWSFLKNLSPKSKPSV